MRRNLFLFVLLLSSLFAIGAGKEPYYIVDGQPGVPVDQLPPMEEIDSRKELDPEEAAYIYGKRAANGAVIICTKEYAHRKKVQAEQDKREYERNQAREEQERIQRETIAKQQAIQQQKDQKIYLIIFCIESVIVAFILFLLLRKSKKSIEEASHIAKIEDSKHVAKSERFNVTDSSIFQIKFFLLIALVILSTLELIWSYTPARTNIMNFIILVPMEGYVMYCIIESIICLSQCYIIVDDEGIRGVYEENVLLFYKGINIRWEQVASANVNIEPWMKGDVKRLVLYSDEDCQNEVESIFLLYFPTSEITAQINRFYARYSGKILIK